MSRSKHGHKHSARSTCSVCTDLRQVRRRQRADQDRTAIPEGVEEYDDQCEEKE